MDVLCPDIQTVHSLVYIFIRIYCYDSVGILVNCFIGIVYGMHKERKSDVIKKSHDSYLCCCRFFTKSGRLHKHQIVSSFPLYHIRIRFEKFVNISALHKVSYRPQQFSFYQLWLSVHLKFPAKCFFSLVFIFFTSPATKTIKKDNIDERERNTEKTKGKKTRDC